MRVFLGVHLPCLPLDVFRPQRPARPEPDAGCGCAVLEQGVVLLADAAAQAAGVRAGMKRGGVLTLAPGTRLIERDPAREADALSGAARVLLRFSPCVARLEEATLVVDVGASLRLFGGLPALCRQVRAQLACLGCAVRIGAAPTGGGAWLFARIGRRQDGGGLQPVRRVARPASLVRALDALPCMLLPDARAFAGWLEGLGCRTLADLRRLPRAELQRRCGPALVAALDRAYGDAPEPLGWLPVPPVFDVRIELPERVEHAQAVLFVARRLVAQLVGWLSARQLSLTALELSLEHERGRQAVPPTALELAFAAPVRDDAHVLRVLNERLARVVLPGAVIAVRLAATRVADAEPAPDDLFPEPGSTQAERARLIELLTARLGAQHVRRPAPVDDYRPEVANRWLPLDASAAGGAGRVGRVGRAGRSDRQGGGPPPMPPRPAWLLPEPQPLLVRENKPVYRGMPLTLASGIERIEAGWFDARPVVRDYYVAQDDDGACYWIFRAQSASGAGPGWFLHGFFG